MLKRLLWFFLFIIYAVILVVLLIGCPYIGTQGFIHDVESWPFGLCIYLNSTESSSDSDTYHVYFEVEWTNGTEETTSFGESYLVYTADELYPGMNETCYIDPSTIYDEMIMVYQQEWLNDLDDTYWNYFPYSCIIVGVILLLSFAYHWVDYNGKGKVRNCSEICQIMEEKWKEAMNLMDEYLDPGFRDANSKLKNFLYVSMAFPQDNMLLTTQGNYTPEGVDNLVRTELEEPISKFYEEYEPCLKEKVLNWFNDQGIANTSKEYLAFSSSSDKIKSSRETVIPILIVILCLIVVITIPILLGLLLYMVVFSVQAVLELHGDPSSLKLRMIIFPIQSGVLIFGTCLLCLSTFSLGIKAITSLFPSAGKVSFLLKEWIGDTIECDGSTWIVSNRSYTVETSRYKLTISKILLPSSEYVWKIGISFNSSLPTTSFPSIKVE